MCFTTPVNDDAHVKRFISCVHFFLVFAFISPEHPCYIFDQLVFFSGLEDHLGLLQATETMLHYCRICLFGCYTKTKVCDSSTQHIPFVGCKSFHIAFVNN